MDPTTCYLCIMYVEILLSYFYFHQMTEVQDALKTLIEAAEQRR